jgi:hypothetical protein
VALNIGRCAELGKDILGEHFAELDAHLIESVPTCIIIIIR